MIELSLSIDEIQLIVWGLTKDSEAGAALELAKRIIRAAGEQQPLSDFQNLRMKQQGEAEEGANRPA